MKDFHERYRFCWVKYEYLKEKLQFPGCDDKNLICSDPMWFFFYWKFAINTINYIHLVYTVYENGDEDLYIIHVGCRLIICKCSESPHYTMNNRINSWKSIQIVIHSNSTSIWSTNQIYPGNTGHEMKYTLFLTPFISHGNLDSHKHSCIGTFSIASLQYGIFFLKVRGKPFQTQGEHQA